MVAHHRLDFSKCEQQWQSHLAIQPGNIVTTPWGRGLGKSWFGRTELYLQVAQWEYKLRPGASHPGVRCVVLMPTLEQAKKVHGDLLCIELESEWGPLGGKVNRTTWRVTFPGGSWIQFVSAERAHLLRGIRCDVVFVDECDDVPTSIVNSVVIPWFSEPHSLRIQIRSGTPRMGRKGLLYFSHHELPKKLPGRAFAYHATGYDAPLIVSPLAIEDARLTTPEEIFKREWLCDYDSAEGLVYPSFKEGFHVRPPPEGVTWDDVFVCGDHGFQDPGVLLLCGVLGHGNDAVMWVIAEIYQQHQDPIWWFDQASRWIAWYPRAWWFLDPSRPDMIKGYRSRGARIGETDNDIQSGVGCVQQMLKIHSRKGADGGVEEYARLYVDPSCKNTIHEFGLYRHRRDARDPEVMTEDIVDKHNHCFVAGTPVLTDRGTVPIESVTTADRVLTRDGWEPVKASGMTNPSADTWHLDLSNGVRLEATPDHLVWTVERGFVRLDSLRYGDTLLSSRGPFAVHVVAVSPTGRRAPVYDLTIDGRPEFFAGGVLVHNSMDGVRYGVVGRFFPERVSRRNSASFDARL